MVDTREDNPNHKKLKPREKHKRANQRKFQREKTQNSEHKLAHGIHYAEKALDEVKEIAKVLRPFLTNGAILLGSNWDRILEDQIRTAIDGVIRRPVVNTETGDIVLGDDGNLQYQFIAVDAKDQLAARKHLIDIFPKLIPESAKALDVDPTVALAKVLQEGGGGKVTVGVEVESPEYEPDDNVIDGVARFIDDEATIELDTANAQ